MSCSKDVKSEITIFSIEVLRMRINEDFGFGLSLKRSTNLGKLISSPFVFPPKKINECPFDFDSPHLKLFCPFRIFRRRFRISPLLKFSSLLKNFFSKLSPLNNFEWFSDKQKTLSFLLLNGRGRGAKTWNFSSYKFRTLFRKGEGKTTTTKLKLLSSSLSRLTFFSSISYNKTALFSLVPTTMDNRAFHFSFLRLQVMVLLLTNYIAHFVIMVKSTMVISYFGLYACSNVWSWSTQKVKKIGTVVFGSTKFLGVTDISPIGKLKFYINCPKEWISGTKWPSQLTRYFRKPLYCDK